MRTNAKILAAVAIFALGYFFHATAHRLSRSQPHTESPAGVTQGARIQKSAATHPVISSLDPADFDKSRPVRSPADARAFLNEIVEKQPIPSVSFIPKIEFVRDEDLSPADRANVEDARIGLAAEGKKVVATRIGNDGGINIHIIKPYAIDELPDSVKRYASLVDIQEFQDRLTYAAVEADASNMMEHAPNK